MSDIILQRSRLLFQLTNMSGALRQRRRGLVIKELRVR